MCEIKTVYGATKEQLRKAVGVCVSREETDGG